MNKQQQNHRFRMETNCRANNMIYSKTCLKWPLKKRSKIDFQDRLSLNAGRKYCRMLQKSILQYFRPALSYHLSLRSLFCLCLSGRFRQVILYVLKFRTLFSFCSHINSWLSGLESANCLSE